LGRLVQSPRKSKTRNRELRLGRPIKGRWMCAEGGNVRKWEVVGVKKE